MGLPSLSSVAIYLFYRELTRLSIIGRYPTKKKRHTELGLGVSLLLCVTGVGSGYCATLRLVKM